MRARMPPATLTDYEHYARRGACGRDPGLGSVS